MVSAGTQEEQRQAADGAAPLSTGCLPPAASSQVATAPATFYTAVGGNDWYWRASAPARALGAKLCVIPEAEMEKALLAPNEDTAFPWTLLQDRNDPEYVEARYPAHEGDTAVWTRPDPPRAVHAQQMREQGILNVGETDDNYLSPAIQNIFQRSSGFGAEGQDMHLRSLASMDRIVFSTEWLRDFYFKAIHKTLRIPRGKIPELFVARNHVDLADWPEPIPRSGPLRVGWMGSPSHVWDVDIAWNALLHASNMGCQTYMIGYDPSDPDGGRFPEERRTDKSRQKIAQWKRVGFQFVPWQKPVDYHRSALPLDVGLAPILGNRHTDGKSDVKFCEYSMSGAATIATNSVVYQTIKHMETGILVGSQREMLSAVDLLIRDSALRERLVANARQYFREERGLKQLREEWGAAVLP